MTNKIKKRKSGILMHITSLPGKEPIGTLGPEAFDFVDKLEKASQTVWQILPLGHTGFQNSPYAAFSAFAGNPFIINLEKLSNDTFFEEYNSNFTNKVDFDLVAEKKISYLKKIANDYIKKGLPENYRKFEKDNEFWLNDYALYISLKQNLNCKPIFDFEPEIINRNHDKISELEKNLGKDILENKVIQYFFFEQWFELKKYANSKSIQIFGDIPLYVSADSADIWACRENFSVDKFLKPKNVAGVPPDYFSPAGQMWGNPVYNWDFLQKTNFDWWTKRLLHNLQLFDILRIDHFRGLLQYWSIPAESPDAGSGKWCNVPSEAFFETVISQIPEGKLIAEDLGFITDDVTKMRKKYNLSGMKILQFAFAGNIDNSFLPHNFSRKYTAYTGTHDNDTTLGWYKKLSETEKQYVNSYLWVDTEKIAHSFIKLLWSTVAETVIAPMQDVLNSGTEARMNIPGTNGENWNWRMKHNEFSDTEIEFLKEITKIYGR